MEPGYIAFFDSGIGGLTLLKECAQQLAGESFLYFGDNANAPYGNKSPEEIERLTLTAFGYLSRFPLKAAVLACNTVTAECAAALRARCPFPVLGVEPALKPAAKACKNVLVLATRATLSSKKFRALAESVSGAVEFTAVSSTSFLNKPLKDLRPKDGMLVAAIVREGKTIIPDGNTSIHAGDRVIVMAKSFFLHELDDILA